MSKASPGAALSAMRRWHAFTCAWCGKGFTAQDPRARFCSNKCKQADKYARSKAAAKPPGFQRP